jgi:hypothetical protein
MVGVLVQQEIETLQRLKKPYKDLLEDQQRTIIAESETQKQELVMLIVEQLLSLEHSYMVGTLLDPKKGQKDITVKLAFDLRDENQGQLLEYANKSVVVIFADPEDFVTNQNLPDAEPDQGVLL